MNRLHFGCFNCPVDGWINTDVTPHLRIARVPGLASLLHALGKMSDERMEEHRRGVFRRVRYLDVAGRWPFGDDSFEAVFSSHVLEHLPLHVARHCARESHRTLARGGVLRIAVPDLDALIQDYAPEGAFDWAVNFFEASEVSAKNRHSFMYNFHSMRTLLSEAGFREVHRRSYREGICPDLDRLDNRPASLFVEAVK